MTYKINLKNQSRIITAKIDRRHKEIAGKLGGEIYMPAYDENKIRLVKCVFKDEGGAFTMQFALPERFNNISMIEGIIKTADKLLGGLNAQ